MSFLDLAGSTSTEPFAGPMPRALGGPVAVASPVSARHRALCSTWRSSEGEATRPSRTFFCASTSAGRKLDCSMRAGTHNAMGGLSGRAIYGGTGHGNEQGAWLSVEETAHRHLPSSVDFAAAVVPLDNEVGADLAHMKPKVHVRCRNKQTEAQCVPQLAHEIADAGPLGQPDHPSAIHQHRTIAQPPSAQDHHFHCRQEVSSALTVDSSKASRSKFETALW